jgi:hypothetical protein
MTTLVITHDVTDIAAWQRALAAGAAIRRRHGSTGERFLVEGTSVLGLLDFPDDAAAQAFLADPELRRPIPGVPGVPTVRLLHEVRP